MKLLRIISLLILSSCSTFNTYSKYTKITTCGDVVCLRNDSIKWQYKSFGGFKYATNINQYRKIRKGKKTTFKNILIYGQSKVLNTNYYFIIDNNKYPGGFDYKDTLISGKKITIALENPTMIYKPSRDYLLNLNK